MYLTTLTKIALACIVLFFVTRTGYAMQPPPPPLNLTQLGRLISEADLIQARRANNCFACKNWKKRYYKSLGSSTYQKPICKFR